MRIKYLPAPAGLLPEDVVATAIPGEDVLHVLLAEDASIEDLCAGINEVVAGLLDAGMWQHVPRPKVVAS